jgi:hypothetical protein
MSSYDEGVRPGGAPPPPKPTPNPGPPKGEAYPPIPPHIARRIGHIVGPATRSVLKRRAEVGLARAA